MGVPIKGVIKGVDAAIRNGLIAIAAMAGDGSQNCQRGQQILLSRQADDFSLISRIDLDRQQSMAGGPIAHRALFRNDVTDPQPSSRKGAAIALILLLILAWAALVASLAPVVGRWPVLVQAPFYLIMGLAWIIPLKPLVRWSQTGRWRKAPGPAD